MIKNFIQFIFLILVISSLFSCNGLLTKSTVSYPDGPPLIYDESYIINQPLSEEELASINFIQRRDIIYKDNTINDDIIMTLFSDKSKFNPNSKLGTVILEKLSGVELKFSNMLGDHRLPSNFKKYLPFDTSSISLLWKIDARSHDYIESYAQENFSEKWNLKNSFCTKFDKIKIKSDQFPNSFYFPIDLMSPQGLCKSSKYDEHNYSLMYTEKYQLYNKTKYYLGFDLPPIVSFFYCEGSRKDFSKKDSLIAIRIDSNCQKKFTLLRPTNLIFEPAFTTFATNIKLLWDLYLINIRFNILKDTLFHFKSLDKEGVTIAHNPSKLNFCIYPNSFYINNSDEIIAKKIGIYLKACLLNKQEIYKSYFELILWKMYECSEFTLKRDEPEKASFTFTSNNPKYPGNYEVFFSIYEPNLFKVKKL